MVSVVSGLPVARSFFHGNIWVFRAVTMSCGILCLFSMPVGLMIGCAESGTTYPCAQTVMSGYLVYAATKAGYILTSIFGIVVSFFRCGQLELVQPDVQKFKVLNYAFSAVNYLLFLIAITGWAFLIVCAMRTDEWHGIGMYVAVFGMLIYSYFQLVIAIFCVAWHSQLRSPVFPRLLIRVVSITCWLGALVATPILFKLYISGGGGSVAEWQSCLLLLSTMACYIVEFGLHNHYVLAFDQSAQQYQKLAD